MTDSKTPDKYSYQQAAIQGLGLRIEANHIAAIESERHKAQGIVAGQVAAIALIAAYMKDTVQAEIDAEKISGDVGKEVLRHLAAASAKVSASMKANSGVVDKLEGKLDGIRAAVNECEAAFKEIETNKQRAARLEADEDYESPAQRRAREAAESAPPGPVKRKRAPRRKKAKDADT